MSPSVTGGNRLPMVGAAVKLKETIMWMLCGIFKWWPIAVLDDELIFKMLESGTLCKPLEAEILEWLDES